MSVIANFLLDLSKPDKWIFFPCRLEKDHGEGAGWEFVLVMGMEEENWRREDRGGGWEIIQDEIGRMKHVEQNTTIGCDVMNEDYIEDF